MGNTVNVRFIIPSSQNTSFVIRRCDVSNGIVVHVYSNGIVVQLYSNGIVAQVYSNGRYLRQRCYLGRVGILIFRCR